jgi:hypothetical protein
LADSSEIAEAFTNLLTTCFLDKDGTPDIEAAALGIMQALNSAAELVIPARTVKLQGPRRRASAGLLAKIKDSKTSMRNWRKAGRPGPYHPTSQTRKSSKRAVRCQQGLVEIRDRVTFYNRIMADVNTQNMHKLIKTHRQRDPETAAIHVQGELCLDPETQVEGWSRHFKELGTSGDDDRFDNDYLTLVEENNTTISALVNQSCMSNPYSISEVEESIDKLNTGKAADEWGIVAEHLKTAKGGVARPLLDLLNNIRQRRFVPESLKSGVVTPISKKKNQSWKWETTGGLLSQLSLERYSNLFCSDVRENNRQVCNSDSQKGYHLRWL